MWLSAIKLAVSTGSKLYANRQKTKQAMSDARLMHAERMARGEEAYQGKLLEATTRLERRVRFGDSLGARDCFNLGSCIR